MPAGAVKTISLSLAIEGEDRIAIVKPGTAELRRLLPVMTALNEAVRARLRADVAHIDEEFQECGTVIVIVIGVGVVAFSADRDPDRATW